MRNVKSPSGGEVVCLVERLGGQKPGLRRADGAVTAETVAITCPDEDAITIPAGVGLILEASVTDDGLPSGSLTTTWSKQSGPGTVTFGSANADTTTAQFDAVGTYVLECEGGRRDLSIRVDRAGPAREGADGAPR